MPTVVKSDDPRVRRTRQLIQHAFMDLLNAQPFHDITVQDIAGRAGVNRATFYAHYEDKFDLVDDVIRERFRGLLRQRLPAAAPWSADHLRELIQTVFDFLMSIPHHCAPNATRDLDPLFESTIQEEVRAVLLGWLRERATAPADGNPEIAATLGSWAIFGTAAQWSRGPRTVPAGEMVRQVHAIFVSRW